LRRTFPRQAVLSAVLLACSASATGTGTGPAPVLTGIEIIPPLAQVQVNDSVWFSVTGRLSDGSTDPVAVTWSATGGTISPAGLYHAPAVAGSALVIATTTDGLFADTASISLSLTSVGPPAGAVLVSEGFDNGAVSSRGWYDNTSPVISSAEFHGGTGSLEMTWSTGGTVPAHGGAVRHKFTPTDRVYLRYWVKYSNNFVGSGQTYHPHEFYFVTNEDDDYVGPSTTHLTTYVEINYQNGGVPMLSMTDASNIDVGHLNIDLTNVTEARASAGCNGSADGYRTSCYQLGSEWKNEKIWRGSMVTFQPIPGPGYKGDWNLVEAYYQLNSIVNGKGQRDGVAQYWFNGALITDHHDIIFRTAAHPNMQFNQFLIAPYIGDGSPVPQSMWVDDLVIATGKVP
jgi:hypothetical protein